MVFSSSIFIFIFLPVCVIGYFILPQKLKNFWLLLTSLFFYSWGEPKYVLLMIFTITINFLLANVIDKCKSKGIKRWLLVLTILVNVGLLGYFKYCDFFISNVNYIFKSNISIKNIVLPIGISFYIFQSMSYVIDVYKNEVQVQKNLLKLGLYVSFFPQLIAGPIVRYRDIEKEIDCRVKSVDNIYAGLRLFMLGFVKKILLADQLAPYVTTMFSIDGGSMMAAWTGAVAYTLQIYFDFSGYSDMAIGLGKIFGFSFPDNFNYPYLSASIKEFWRRWHISLSSWFRDYVYFPLGGNRKGKVRTYINLLVIFFLTGLWHGASWNFICWGLYHGFFILIERMGGEKILKKLPQVVQHCYTMIVVIIGWVFFNADSLGSGLRYLKNMFTLNENWKIDLIGNLNPLYVFCILCGCLFSTPVLKRIKNSKVGLFCERYAITDIVLILFFIVAISYMVGTGFSPFLYFRF